MVNVTLFNYSSAHKGNQKHQTYNLQPESSVIIIFMFALLFEQKSHLSHYF